MLSSHYPLAFASELNWAIAPLVFLLGVYICNYFNNYHENKKSYIGLGLSLLSFLQ